MNSTKRKILDAGRELFNLYGIGNVPQRRITEYLGISPGNLTYHFKKSDEIVEALYFELVHNINAAMAEVKNMNYDLKFMFRLIHILIHNFYENRFIFLDFVHIMRNHEKIKLHYEQLSILRQQQFMEAVHFLVEQKVMRKEELPSEYVGLYERFEILTNFWIASVEIKKGDVKEVQIDNARKILWQTIYPYLTQKGKSSFLSMNI